jgi:hypothetical protein
MRKLSNRQYLAACVVASVMGLTACGTAAAAPAVTRTMTAKAAPAVTVTAKPKPAVTVTVTVKPRPAIAAAQPTAAAPAPALQFTNAVSVVDQFYQDITDQDYLAAWNLGGDNLNGDSGDSGYSGYSGWVAGYDTTASIALYDAAAFGSDQVTAYLNALQSDGSTRTYYGTYTVSGGVITSASIVQTS